MKPTVHSTHVIGGGLAVVFDPFAERDGPTAPELPPPGSTLIDSCPVEQENDIGSYGLTTGAGGMDAVYQAFELGGAGAKIYSLKVSLVAVGAPTGGIVCGLYNNLTGEFPAVVPVSPWLRNTIPVAMATITPDGGLYEFEFLVKPSLGPGKYAVSVERQSDFGPPGSKINVGFNFDFSRKGKAARAGAAHYGNGGYHQNGAWGADDMADMIFYLYGDLL